jgi:hypothetical protein
MLEQCLNNANILLIDYTTIDIQKFITKLLELIFQDLITV